MKANQLKIKPSISSKRKSTQMVNWMRTTGSGSESSSKQTLIIVIDALLRSSPKPSMILSLRHMIKRMLNGPVYPRLSASSDFIF